MKVPNEKIMFLAGGQSSQKVKAANKLRVQTSKIVSSFKNDSVSCRMVREYVGHRDGVWDVAVSRGGTPVIATASAGETRLYHITVISLK